jgi:lysophospholipase L1-like esterase
MAAKPRLFALLIGIDNYPAPVRALKGCINDVEKFGAYLQQYRQDLDQHILFLKDSAATKKNIADNIRQHLGQAQAGDLALLYYSGHGAQEAADTSIWRFEPDGKLEGIVCYDSIAGPGQFDLLIDKELRFLLHEVTVGNAQHPKKSPHLLTIFDCCHSGGNTRNGYIADETDDDAPRERRFIPTPESRMSNILPQRKWEKFLFANAVNPEDLKTKPLDEVLPEGLYVQLSGCDSDESSFETAGSGVFSRNLIDLLQRSQGLISYTDLRNRLKYFIKNQFQQTPQIYAPGREQSLLNKPFLDQGGTPQPVIGNVVYNPKLGYVIDLGAIHGISNQATEVILYDQAKPAVTYQATIKNVKGGETQLNIPEATITILNGKIIKGYVEHFLSAPIKVFINNYGVDEAPVSLLKAALGKKVKNLSLAAEEKSADYTIQIFNEQYVITLPGDPFRPLVLPEDDLSEDAAAQTAQYMRHIAQWEFAKNLHNDSPDRLNPDAVTIDLFQQIDGKDLPVPVNQDTVGLDFKKGNFDGRPYGMDVKIRIRNTSNFPVYVSLLYLSPAFGIYLDLLNGRVQKLEPKSADNPGGGAVWVFDGDKLGITYDAVFEIFNHQTIQNRFKLIASTEEFEVNTFEQGSLPDPTELINKNRGGAERGITRRPDNAGASGWMARDLIIKSPNPLYNTAPKELNQWLQTAAAPFVSGLYLKPESAFSTVLEMQPSDVYPANLEAELDPATEKGFIQDNIIIPTANFFAKQQRQIRYRSIIKQHPDWVRIVSEGDSWFEYPDPRVLDVIDQLFGSYAIYSSDEAGDTIEHYFRQDEYFKAVVAQKPTFLLLSGGGNDILGKQFLDSLVDHFPQRDPGVEPERFLSPVFFQKITTISETYVKIFEKIKAQDPKLNIIVHGYDYFNPSNDPKKGFLGRYMMKKNILESVDRKALARYIIDVFNEMLGKVVKPYDRVHYLDLRGTVTDPALWWDEIHPNSRGFQKVGAKFEKLINGLNDAG